MNHHKRIKNLSLFKIYHETKGNLFIPPRFTVPETSEWPVDSVGYALGQFANHIRQQMKKSALYYDPNDVQVLTDLGFVWDLTQYKSQVVLLAAQTYKALYNSMDMKNKFEVPTNDERWPEITWGLKLHGTLQNIKNLFIHSTIHDELRALGVTITSREKSAQSGPSKASSAEDKLSDDEFSPKNVSTRVDPSKLRSIEHIDLLTIYKTLYGDLLVPVKFEIPDDDEGGWPKSAVGFALGDFVKKLRVSIKKSRKSYRPDALQQLADLDFVWDLTEHKASTLLSALKTFKSLNDHVDVPYNFVVPSEEPWPRAAWGLKLGSVLNNVRYNLSFQYIKPELLALGVDYTVGHHGSSGTGGSVDEDATGLIPRNTAISTRSLTSGAVSSDGVPITYREMRYYPAPAAAAAAIEDSDSEEEMVASIINVKNSSAGSSSSSAKPSSQAVSKIKAIAEPKGFRAKKKKIDE